MWIQSGLSVVSPTRRGYRLQNGPYAFQESASSQTKGLERGWKQRARLGRDAKNTVFFLSPHTPYGRVRLARFARVRFLRHALPISLLILRKKPTLLQSSVAMALEVTCATISPYFKRLCNAICCVFKKHQLNSKNNDPVLLLKSIFTVNPLFSPHS